MTDAKKPKPPKAPKMSPAEVSRRLKAAGTSKKQTYFYLAMVGLSGKPELLVHTDESKVRKLGKEASVEGKKLSGASTKRFARGRVETGPKGRTSFFAEGTYTETVLKAALWELRSTITVPDELLKQQNFYPLKDAPSLMEPVEAKPPAAKKGDKAPDDDEDEHDEQEEEEEEEEAVPAPTKEDWVRASSAAKALYLEVKSKFGEDSPLFAQVKDAQQVALSAKKGDLAAGLDELDIMVSVAKRALGTAVPPTLDWEAVNAQLQLAKKATRPFWFWFCRQGEDDLPVLIIARKEQEMKAASKDARRSAKKKKAVSGWIEKGADGGLIFWAEGDVPFNQVERDFKQRVASIDAMSTTAPLLRKASFRTIEADSTRPLDDEADDGLLKRQLNTEIEQIGNELRSKSTPPAVRYPQLRADWNKVVLDCNASLRALRAQVEADRVLSQLPEGVGALQRLTDLAAFYSNLRAPLDDALNELVRTQAEAEHAPVVAAATKVLAGLKSRGELSTLEEKASGGPALYSAQLSALNDLISDLS